MPWTEESRVVDSAQFDPGSMNLFEIILVFMFITEQITFPVLCLLMAFTLIIEENHDGNE